MYNFQNKTKNNQQSNVQFERCILSDSVLSLSQLHVKCLLPPSTVHLEELTFQTRNHFIHMAPSEIRMVKITLSSARDWIQLCSK